MPSTLPVWYTMEKNKVILMLDWTELEQSCKVCRKCSLSESRTNVVFGSGDQNAEVLFIGEGPGQQEDLTGFPFVGRAGRLLDDMLAAIGLTRDKIYIANIIKCRPPKNRDPQPDEQEACIDWLRNQFYLINPKIVVCLGRIAAVKLIKNDFKITKEHGIWFDKGNYKFMATFHPAFLLRDPNRRPDAFEDLKKLEDRIKQICTHTL